MSWYTPNTKTINRLNILQKKAIRIITKSRYNAHTSPLFKNLNILKLDDLYKKKPNTLLEICK